MVKVLVGNLFDSEAQTLVNTVNCVGVMGKGIALDFKKRFPEMYEDYQLRCRRGEVKLGMPYLFRTLLMPWILNFPTKDHWRSVARIEDITRGLNYLLANYRDWGITSLAVPPLGCGEGQLEWRVVGKTLYRYLAKMDIPVELYAPFGTRDEELRAEFLQDRANQPFSDASRRTVHVEPGWVALVEIVARLEDQPYHWPIGRTIFQKIAYVATEEGIPTGLCYERGSYGPFASQLKPVVTRLVNNGLISEQRQGRMFTVQVGPTFQDARKVYGSYLTEWDDVIDKIVDLFARMNTDQAEVAATVMFSAHVLAKTRGNRPSEADVLKDVMDWKQRRKPPLDETTVAWTVRNLAALRWLAVQSSPNLPLPSEEEMYM